MLQVLPLNTSFKSYVNHYYDNATQVYIKLASGYHPIEATEDTVKSLITGLEINKTEIEWYYRSPVVKEIPLLSARIINYGSDYESLCIKVGERELAIVTDELRAEDVDFLVYQLQQLRSDMPC